MFYSLILGILAVWRVTHLLHAEDGPWDALLRLRNALRGRMPGRVLDCFYCLSLWIAIPFVVLLAPSPREGVLLWLALSAGAILLERITQRQPVPAAYIEDPLEFPESESVQLR